jgi:hypothetical protein
VATEISCPECQSRRTDPSVVCPTCGAPPVREGDKRNVEEEVRSQDLEPYITLRYIARLFKVLAVLMAIMLIGEIILSFMADEPVSIPDLIARVTQLMVLAGLMWGGGDVTLLLIDAGHDLRVARILLGRINHEMHRRASLAEGKTAGADEPRQQVARAPR